MKSNRESPQFKLRFSSLDLKEWIAQQAEKNHRSLNGEINYHLEQAMLKQQQEDNNVK